MALFCAVLVLSTVAVLLALLLCLTVVVLGGSRRPIHRVRSQARRIETETLDEMERISSDLNRYIINQTHQSKR